MTPFVVPNDLCTCSCEVLAGSRQTCVHPGDLQVHVQSRGGEGNEGGGEGEGGEQSGAERSRAERSGAEGRGEEGEGGEPDNAEYRPDSASSHTRTYGGMH